MKLNFKKYSNFFKQTYQNLIIKMYIFNDFKLLIFFINYLLVKKKINKF